MTVKNVKTFYWMNKWWITGEPLVMHLYFRQVLTFENILDCVMSLDAHSVFQTRSLMGSPTGGEPLSRCVPASPSNINHRCSPTHYVMWILMQLQYFSNVKKKLFYLFDYFSFFLSGGARGQPTILNFSHSGNKYVWLFPTVCFQPTIWNFLTLPINMFECQRQECKTRSLSEIASAKGHFCQW